jgi:hypothetical protein
MLARGREYKLRSYGCQYRLSLDIILITQLDVAETLTVDLFNMVKGAHKMLTSLHSVGKAAVGAVGAGMVTGAMLFGGTPIAQAAPPPAPGTTFDTAGPHGAPDFPLRPGGGGGGGGHGGGGHGGWGGGGHGGPGGWGGHGGNWGGHGGDWGGHGGNWGRGGDWGRGGWGRGGWGGRGGDWDDHGANWGGHPGWGNGGWGPPGLGWRPWWAWWW